MLLWIVLAVLGQQSQDKSPTGVWVPGYYCPHNEKKAYHYKNPKPSDTVAKARRRCAYKCDSEDLDCFIAELDWEEGQNEDCYLWKKRQCGIWFHIKTEDTEKYSVYITVQPGEPNLDYVLALQIITKRIIMELEDKTIMNMDDDNYNKKVKEVLARQNETLNFIVTYVASNRSKENNRQGLHNAALSHFLTKEEQNVNETNFKLIQWSELTGYHWYCLWSFIHDYCHREKKKEFIYAALASQANAIDITAIELGYK